MTSEEPGHHEDVGASSRISQMGDGLECLIQSDAIDAPPRPGIAGTLDRFEVMRRLGNGGMGIVLEVRDPRTNEIFAAKVMRPELVSNRRAVKRFFREAHHMQRLKHPSIVPAIEVFHRPTAPFFTMPLLTGTSLEQSLDAGKPLPDVRCFQIARDVAEALAYAHEQGVTHRDLKPGNILMNDGGRAVLSDFGLSMTVFNDTLIDVGNRPREGTLAYMSPGTIRGAVEDTRCDIYAFGAVLYEMLTGEPPYQADSPEQLAQKILTTPPPPVQSLNAAADAHLSAIARGCMARELRDRYSSMNDVIADLQRAANGKMPAGASGGVRRPRRRRALTWTIAAFAGIAAMVAALLPILQGDDDRPRPRVNAQTVWIDDFEGAQLDEQRWHIGHRQESGVHDARAASTLLTFQARQEDGDLVLTASSKASDNAVVQRLWVDSSIDFRSLESPGEAVVIDLHLSFDSLRDDAPTNAGLKVQFTNGNEPGRAVGEEVTLYWANGLQARPVAIRNQRIRIELLPDVALAVVTTGTGASEEIQLHDLSRLSQWRLRLITHVGTSIGFPPGRSELRVHRIEVARRDAGQGAAGWVIDEVTRRPISDIRVADQSSSYAALTGRDGSFVLATPENATELKIEAAGFIQSRTPAASIRNVKGWSRHVVRLKKSVPGPGEPVEGFDGPPGSLAAVLATPTHFLFTKRQGQTPVLMRLGPSGGEEQLIGKTQQLPVGMARVGDRVYCILEWPGRIASIDVTNGNIRKLHDISVSYPLGLTSDGQQLWFLEVDGLNRKYGICRFNPTTGRINLELRTGDSQIRGLTFVDGRLLVSSLAGHVYIVDPVLAAGTRIMEDGLIGKFPGLYRHLAAVDEDLWAVDDATGRFCRIPWRRIPALTANGEN